MADTDRMLVFGGPYGNLAALEALRAIADGLDLRPSQVVCTGDTVAYCAQPNETVEAIRSWGIAVVAGNVERQLAAGGEDCGCNFVEGTTCQALSDRWYAFLREEVLAEHVGWMRALPGFVRFVLGGLDGCVVHGAWSDVSRFVFASTPWRDKREEIALAGSKFVVAGHSGIPFAESREGLLWVNPGVIGMPANDGTARGWYGLLESEPNGAALRVSIEPFEYDHARTRSRMRERGLSEAYALALGTGLWPGDEILPQRERARRGRPLTPLRLTHRWQDGQ